MCLWLYGRRSSRIIQYESSVEEFHAPKGSLSWVEPETAQALVEKNEERCSYTGRRGLKTAATKNRTDSRTGSELPPAEIEPTGKQGTHN